MKFPWTTAGLLILLAACASTTPDHFYVLTVQGQRTSDARPAPTAQATLKLTLPASADRAEMLLDASDGRVVVIEHERWAAPLTDLATQTLARDIERRRNDMLVFTHDMGRSKDTDLRIAVDVVQITLRRGGQARIEAQWQIIDAHSGKVVVGGGDFSVPLAEGDYAVVARSLSECLGLLADRLVAQMP
jgi:uncharacterized lipoprotein YmbA